MMTDSEKMMIGTIINKLPVMIAAGGITRVSIAIGGIVTDYLIDGPWIMAPDGSRFAIGEFVNWPEPCD